MMKRLGDKLRTLREQRGLTLRELAELLDVHYTHLNKIELGLKRPSTDVVLKISYLFNVTTDELMKDELELDGGDFD